MSIVHHHHLSHRNTSLRNTSFLFLSLLPLSPSSSLSQYSAFFTSLASALKTSPHLFSPRSLSTIAHSLGSLRSRSAASVSIFGVVESCADRIVEDGDTRAVANAAWACAALNVQSPSLFLAIESNADRIVRDGSLQTVANVAWSCAVLASRSPSFFLAISSNSSRLAQTGTPRVVSTVAWSCAKLHYHAPSLFRSVDSCSSRLVRNGNPQDVANTALAFATVGIHPNRLFAELRERGNLDRFLEGANSQEVCNLAWSVAVLEGGSGIAADLLPALWAAALRNQEGVTADEGLSQLAQVHLHARASGVALSPPLPTALRRRMVAACRNVKSGGSRFEAVCSRLLDEIGFEHERSVSPFGAGGCDDDEGLGEFLAIDMACRRRKIAVECDGRTHFLTELTAGAKENFGGKEDGRTAAKRRLLTQLGWRVVNVPFQDGRMLESKEYKWKNRKWAKNGGGTRELKRRYLAEKLARFEVRAKASTPKTRMVSFLKGVFKS